MIKLVEKTPKNKKIQEPVYVLTYNYMIGDANGDTEEEVELSLNNPFIEQVVTAFNKLKPTQGYWGIGLEYNRMYAHFKEKQITQDEYILLQTAIAEGDYDPIEADDFEEKDNPLMLSDQDKDYLAEFSEGIRSQTEYSFLVFKGAHLEYIDEYGEVHQTEFVD